MDKLFGGSKHGLFPVTDRTMKFPYTLTAQIRQFPYKFMFKNQWIFRYWCYSVILCLPVFYKIQQLSYSPANVEKWKKIRAKEAEEHHH